MMKVNQLDYSKKQWDIITSTHHHKKVIAAAGSGKTRTVIGYTMYYLQNHSDKQKILILSFSRKACGEILSRLPEEYKSSVEVRTFHAFCYHYIKKYHPIYSNTDFKILLDSHKEEYLKKLFRDDPEITYGIPYKVIIKNFYKLNQYLPNLFNLLNAKLNQYKLENQFLEFQDLIEIVLKGLENNEQWIEPLRKIYTHIIVDEFQDTDPQQLKFLYLTNPVNLLIVGDDWQAIYGFRGATVEPFINFSKFFRKTKTFKLDENYRSLSPIIQLSNKIIDYSSKKIQKVVKTKRKHEITFPVLGHLLNENIDPIIELIQKYNVMVLVRSNARKDYWIQNGVPQNNIMTIHKSKGLEFPVVFIDIVKGWSGESLFVDEEIRILYVAITRAQNLCVFLYDEYKKSLESFIVYYILKKDINSISIDLLEKYLNQEINSRIST